MTKQMFKTFTFYWRGVRPEIAAISCLLIEIKLVRGCFFCLGQRQSLNKSKIVVNGGGVQKTPLTVVVGDRASLFRPQLAGININNLIQGESTEPERFYFEEINFSGNQRDFLHYRRGNY